MSVTHWTSLNSSWYLPSIGTFETKQPHVLDIDAWDLWSCISKHQIGCLLMQGHTNEREKPLDIVHDDCLQWKRTTTQRTWSASQMFVLSSYSDRV